MVPWEVRSAAARNLPTRARTIARWYEAARSRAPCLELRLGEVAHGVEQGGLEAREREVEPRDACHWERKGVGVTLSRESIELRASRVAEPEQPRPLVERLARGIVEGRAEDLEARPVANVEQERVPSTREQARERRLEGIGSEVERRDVRVEMVDGHERQAPCPGERLRGREADEQCTDEPGALRHADAVDRVQPDACLVESGPDDRGDELEMPPRCDLRHDAPVPGVELGLRSDDRGGDDSVSVDDRRGGLATAARTLLRA